MDTIKKRQIGIRIPRELDKKLETKVAKIGVSKAAFILTLIYEALSKEERTRQTEAEE